MSQPTMGSLFAGIGGFDVGFERAGFEIRWQVEIDSFCRKVLEKHWPNAKRYDDVRSVGNDLEYVDWICGGFPCQDLSSGGKRVGLEGPRSGLWREFLRVVEQRKPRGVVIENVHHSWRKWVPVLRSALWTLGYASLPIRLRACDFGAWHERARVFLVAHVDPSVVRLESWRRCWPFWEDPPLFADASQVGWDESTDSVRQWESDVAGRAIANIDKEGELQPERTFSNQRRRLGYGVEWEVEPDVVRVVHGVPSRAYGRWLSDRIGALGNAVIPEEAELIARCILELSGYSVEPV